MWVSMYGCYDHFPQLSSFTATPDGPTRWIVEGRSPDTSYGLWLVDALTGAITPSDRIAEQASENCTPTTVVVTAKQAALRVWLAAYECFLPRPESSVFVASQDSPQRWIVEGRSVDLTTDPPTITLYGLWLVDTDTGDIQAWDQVARQAAANVSCFKRP